MSVTPQSGRGRHAAPERPITLRVVDPPTVPIPVPVPVPSQALAQVPAQRPAAEVAQAPTPTPPMALVAPMPAPERRNPVGAWLGTIARALRG